jgi:prevent-host-death family protein
MPVKYLDSRHAKESWHELLDTVAKGQIDIVITHHGKPLATMIRYEDYAVLLDELTRLREEKLELYQTMLASEPILRREWDTREEDAAWAGL